MKRELKETTARECMIQGTANRKAHPDEKGTERSIDIATAIESPVNRKAHPDEKGTESVKVVLFEVVK